jgi:hypothetical protein
MLGMACVFFSLFEEISGANVFDRSLFGINLLKNERLVSW